MRLYDAWLHGQAHDLFGKDACHLTKVEREIILGPEVVSPVLPADPGWPWNELDQPKGHLRLVRDGEVPG